MPEVTERIDKIEKKLTSHDIIIEQLEKAMEEQKKISAEILEKLNRLVYRDGQSNSTFDHHRLLCRAEFDERYIMKDLLRIFVTEVIDEENKKKLDNTKSISYIISSGINIAWKVIIICGGIYGIISVAGG